MEGLGLLRTGRTLSPRAFMGSLGPREQRLHATRTLVGDTFLVSEDLIATKAQRGEALGVRGGGGGFTCYG